MRTILLVEDNQDDLYLTDLALGTSNDQVDLQIVTTGADALAYLRREGEHADGIRPDLILLDLKLPGISGLEVLRQIKKDQDLSDIPVVVLTTSNNPDDIQLARDLGADEFFTKTIGFAPFLKLIFRISHDWLPDTPPASDPRQ